MAREFDHTLRGATPSSPTPKRLLSTASISEPPSFDGNVELISDVDEKNQRHDENSDRNSAPREKSSLPSVGRLLVELDASILSSETFEPGSIVDNFAIRRLIGRGGMGEVYEAVDLTLGRRVALKTIRNQDMQSPRARERFLFEAKATARFSHPNIVRLHSVGAINGHPYIALEYLEGLTLKETLATRTLAQDEVIHIAASIAEALLEAHRQGIWHRDLKPANVFLASDGRPRVLDFGVAKAVAESVEARGKTVVAGSPRYLSPEKWRNEPSSPAIDIWGLGLILYEMLLGRHPYQGLGMSQLAYQLSTDEPVPGEDELFQFGELGQLTARCLEKNPLLRPTLQEITEILWSLDALPLRGEDPRIKRSQSLPRTLALLLGISLVSFSLAFAIWRTRPQQKITLSQETAVTETNPKTLPFQQVAKDQTDSKAETSNSDPKAKTTVTAPVVHFDELGNNKNEETASDSKNQQNDSNSTAFTQNTQHPNHGATEAKDRGGKRRVNAERVVRTKRVERERPDKRSHPKVVEKKPEPNDETDVLITGSDL